MSGDEPPVDHSGAAVISEEGLLAEYKARKMRRLTTDDLGLGLRGGGGGTGRGVGGTRGGGGGCGGGGVGVDCGGGVS